MDLALIGFKSDTSGLDKADRSLKNLANRGDKTEKSLKGSTGAISMGFARIASAIAATVTSGLALSKLVSVTREFDVLNAQLVTATGSAKKASDAFFAIEQFAKTTPYDLAQSTMAFTKLVGLGLDPSERALRSLGNTASAKGKDLIQLIEAVADAATGEFERLKEFDIKTKQQGENVSFTFKGMTTTVKNEASAIQEYLVALGENDFAGSMALRMATLDGAISNLEDSWDKLFLTVSGAGVGDVVESGVRLAIDAIDELTVRIASGEVEASIAAVTSKFDGFGADVVFTLQTVGDIWEEETKDWGLDGAKSADMIVDAFVNMPENIRALIQLVTVEIASLVDYGLIYGESFAKVFGVQLASIVEGAKTHGKAFAQVLGTEIGLLVEKSKIWGKDMANALNPFSDNIDYTAEYEAATALAADMTNTILADAETKAAIQKSVAREMAFDIISSAETEAEGISQARASTITGIMSERDKAIASYEAQMVKAKDLTTVYKEELVKREKASEGTLDSNKIVPEVNESVVEQNVELEKLIDSVYGVGDAWSESGNVIVDSMGGISNALNQYVSELDKIGKTEEKLAKEKEKYKPDTQYYKDITAAEENLAEKRTRANLSSYASIAGAAGDMFGEQSAAREAFHKVEMALGAIEIAMSLKKASANAITAITAAFSSGPLIGFAAGAAMIAIMSGLGVFSGSSGSAPTSMEERQETQSTGTVLGSDAQSESLLNSFERMEDLEINQYYELKTMSATLIDLNYNIMSLASSFVSNFGKFDADTYSGSLGKVSHNNTGGYFQDMGEKVGQVVDPIASMLGIFTDPLGALVDNIIGSFKTTEKTLLDSGVDVVAQTLGDVIDTGLLEAQQYFDIKTKDKSFWGLSSSTSYDTENSEIDNQLKHEMGLIFSSIGLSVNSALDILGLETENSLDNFLISVSSLSLKDMSGDEIQAELEAMFSSQADLMATYMVPNLAEFQDVGEGLYETLIRVAQEQAIFADNLERTGVVLQGLEPEALITITQDVIALVGGLENFQSLSNDYYEAFFTDEEKLLYLQGSLNDVVTEMGFTLPTTRTGFRELVSSMDLTTATGQEMYATLLEISPAMADYIGQMEELNGVLDDYEGMAKAALSQLEESIEMEKERAQVALSASTDLYTAELELINLQRAAINDTLTAAGSAKDKIQQSVDAEKAIYEQQMNDKLSGIEAERDLATQAHNDKLEALSAEADLAEDNHNSYLDALTSQKDAVSQTISSLSSLSSSLESTLESLSAGLSISQAQAQLDEALVSARGGDFDFDVSGASSALTSQDSGSYTTLVDMMRDSVTAQHKLSELGDLTNTQLSVEERTLAALESAEINAQSQHDSLIASIDTQIDNENESQEAFMSYLDTEAQKVNDEYEGNITRLDQVIENADSQLNALSGIDTNIMTLEESLMSFNDILLAAEFENAQEEFDKLDRLESVALDELSVAEQAYEDEVARLDSLLIEGQSQLNALLGIDTSIMSVEAAILNLSNALGVLSESQDTSPLSQDDSNPIVTTSGDTTNVDELKKEMVKMTEDQNLINVAIAKNTSYTNSLLKRIETNTMMEA